MMGIDLKNTELNCYTSVQLDKEIHRLLKIESAITGKHIRDILEGILSEYFKEKEPVKWANQV